MSEAESNDATILSIYQGDQHDGYAEVTIAPDFSRATASFFPPAPGGSFLTYQVVAAKLEEGGVVSGVLHDAIQEKLLAANSSQQAVKDVLIANGTPPIPEIPEHFVLGKDFVDRRPEIDPNAARIDWHSISAFKIVHAKEPIARRIPKSEGKTGINIRGEEIPFPVKSVQQLQAGANVIDHEKGLFAAKDGRLCFSASGGVSVEEVLVLKTGVDFTTGNIAFPGDVILQGKVADGFKVYAGGSIVSSEVIDATEIVCKKDLVAQSGIEGGQTGVVRVGGSLTAKYIQNCKVAARGDVIVSGSIVQSKVYSMGMIRMGDTGKLVGCECIVIGGVQAMDIGNARGAKTYLRCGTDFTMQQELDVANERLKVIAAKLRQAEEMYKEEPLPDIEAFIQELRKRRMEITERIPAYLTAIDKNDAAFVEVRGTMYPGVEIEICHVSYTVLKQQKQVILRLDKTKGVIVAEPYKKADGKAHPSAS